MSNTLRTSLVIAYAALATLTHAQSWCPPGSEWTFDLGSDVAGQNGVVRVEYDGDTIINGSSAQRLRQWVHVQAPGGTGYATWSLGNLFTRCTPDLVEIHDPATQDFDTLMWFAAQPGQHWTNTIFGGGNEQTITVLGSSTVVVDGTPLRQLVVSGEPALWFGTDTLIERIGYHTLYLRMEQTLSLDGGARNLYCYRDDALSYSTLPSAECGFTVGIRPPLPAETHTLFPNPGTDHFTLRLSPGPHAITLVDVTGRTALQDRTSDGLATIGTGHLPTGIYVVRIDDGVVLGRWVKE